MAVVDWFDKTIIIARLQTVSGSKKNFVATATVDCAFQELDSRARTELGLTQDRAWVGYFDIDDDIKRGDLVILSGIKYKVEEVTQKDYQYSANQHREVILLEYRDD